MGLVFTILTRSCPERYTFRMRYLSLWISSLLFVASCAPSGDLSKPPSDKKEEAGVIYAASEKDILAGLKKTISFDFREEPLENVLVYIQKEIGVRIILDEGLPGRNRAVSLFVQNMPAEMALKWSCNTVGLYHGIKNDCILVSTLEKVRGKPISQTYDLNSLAPGLDAGNFKRVIESRIAAGTWDASMDASIVVRDKALIVTHYPEVHAQISELIDYLRVSRNDK
jgi:hypothetical protein